MSAEGSLIANRYRLQERIGSGAMGIVWRALDERLQRTVAVKQLLLQPGYTEEETEEARQRSMREGRIAARLQHHNAIVVFDVAEDEGHPVLVMEYLPSRSLASVLNEQGTLPPLEVARIGAHAAGALAAAHRAGIVHRDIKPGNILLGDNGNVKITDFGISRAIGDVSVTKSGILAGTPAYLSPEVALGKDPTSASDVFSLGSTLYAAIEGTPPFGHNENAISLLHHVANGRPRPPQQAGPMTAMLMRLLQAEPANRIPMAQARDQLAAVAEGRVIHTAAPATTARSAAHHQNPPQANRPAAPAAAPPQQAHNGAPGPQATRVGMPTARPSPRENHGKSGKRGARSKPIILWALAILTAVVIGILVANSLATANGERAPQGAGTPPAADASQPQPGGGNPNQPSAAPQAQADAAARNVVNEYYSLVPDKLDQAWKHLGPGLRAQGKDSYERWWKKIDEVKIVQPPRASGDHVRVGLKLVRDGTAYLEEHQLGMLRQNETPLINSDNLVSSKTIGDDDN